MTDFSQEYIRGWNAGMANMARFVAVVAVCALALGVLLGWLFL